ncbi:hypothetical protein PG985_013172 [Apiospora marii]|uniref:Zn(2)-C6 fungal-type domain-containing protein n=1 Tax=Apiospora marii TaxID=335849 RepID=A0ABR1R8Y2_9PEZI
MTSCSVCQLPLADEGAQRLRSSRECPFCSAIFSRVDGARRHATSCPKRGNRALRIRKRGRKTKSCDQCSRIKVHCNATHPCERCSSRKLECTFSRYCTDATHRQPTAHQEPPGSLNHGSHNRVPLSFLLNYTDERQDFITEKAVGEEPDGVLLGPTCVAPAAPNTQPPSDTTIGYIDPMMLMPFDDGQTGIGSLELGGLYDTDEQDLLGALLSQTLPSQEDRLAARLDLLELEVTAHASAGHCSTGVSFNPSSFRRFFSVANVQSFAMIFCRKRHYRYPIIHWPKFALEETPLSLLMVVALTGATYSYRPGYGPEHIIEARSLYHLADSYVFHQLRVSLDSMSSTSDINLAEAIQCCQAALLMYGLDTLLANDHVMQRVAMTERLPALVSALRRLELVGCRHDASGDEDWKLFIQREQVIRLVSWTFCVDCLGTLSCNNPPIFSMMEMAGDLPCDPAVWDADSEKAFELLRTSPTRHEISQSLKVLMPRFLDSDARENSEWDNLSLFHLHIIMCALQPIIFNLHVAVCLPQQSSRLLQAMETWRHLWGRALDKIPESHSRYLGIAKNIPDIEHLSRRIIEVAGTPEGDSSIYLQRIPSFSSREIHQFIRRFI